MPFLVETTYRAHSSGSENTGSKLCQTLDDAITYITIDWFEGLCVDYEYPEMWDADDMGMPFPTQEEFRKSVTEKTATMVRSAQLFAPYSNYCALKPIELSIHKVGR